MGVEHTPDVDVVIAFDVEHEIGIALQEEAAQARNRKLVCVARGTRGRTITNHSVGRLQRIDKAQGDVGSSFTNVVVNGGFHVPAGQLARNERLLTHLLLG